MLNMQIFEVNQFLGNEDKLLCIFLKVFLKLNFILDLFPFTNLNEELNKSFQQNSFNFFIIKEKKTSQNIQFSLLEIEDFNKNPPFSVIESNYIFQNIQQIKIFPLDKNNFGFLVLLKSPHQTVFINHLKYHWFLTYN